MTSVNVTTTKNTVTVNGETRVVTVKTQGPQGPAFSDGDKGDVTVSSNGTAISINNSAVTSAKIVDGAIVDADINASAGIQGTKISPNFGSQSIISSLDGNQVTQGNAALTLTHATNSNLRANHLIVDDFPSGGGTYFIQATESGVSNDRNMCLQGYGGKLKIGSNSVAPTELLDVAGNIAVSGTVDGRDVAADGTKLDGIETSATADQTASEILTLLKTVDGAGSGLDADTLDGISSASFLRSDVNATYSGSTLTVNATLLLQDSIKIGDDAFIEDYNAANSVRIKGSQDTNKGFIAFGQQTKKLGVDGASAALTYDGNTVIDSAYTGALANGITATTQSASDNSTKVATTAYTDTAIANLVNSAPSTLDTLGEIATALNNDAALNTTLTNSIATKMPLAGGQFTGNITFSGSQTVDGRDLSVDGTKLDGIESNATADQTASEIVALVADQTIAPSEIDMEDNEKIKLGTGDDLQIYHDGTHSYLDNATGNLHIRGNGADDVKIQAKNGEQSIICHHDGAVELYFDNSKKLETTSYGVAFVAEAKFDNNTNAGKDVVWDPANDQLRWTDSTKATFGTGSDLQIYHDGTNSAIQNSTGILYLYGGSDNIRIRPENGEDSIIAKPNNAVELYYDNSKKLETTSNGVIVSNTITAVDYRSPSSSILYLTSGSNWIFRTDTGSTKLTMTNTGAVSFTGSLSIPDAVSLFLGNSNDLSLKHDGTDSNITNTSGNLNIDGGVHILFTNVHGEDTAKFLANGAIELYYDNSKKLETTSTGVDVTGNVTATGTISSDNITISGAAPKLTFTDTDNNPDYEIRNLNGVLEFKDGTSATNRLVINTDGNLQIPNDSGKLQFGAGQDLQLYHNGSHSYIDETGTGNLYIRNGTKNSIWCQTDGAVKLYYDDSGKLETTSTGVSITGNIAASGGQLTLENGNEEQIHRFWSNTSDSDIYGLLSGSTFGTIVEGSHNGHHVIALRGNDTSDSFAIVSGGGNYQTDSTYDTLVARFYSNGVFHMPDSNQIKLGTGNDLKIFFDGAHSKIVNSTGQLKIQGAASQSITFRNGDDSANVAVFNIDAATHLYYDSGHKFSTTSTGIQVVGNIDIDGNIDGADGTKLKLGTGDDLQIFFDGTHSKIDHTPATGSLFLAGDSLVLANSGMSEYYLTATENGAVQLNYDASQKLTTFSGGISVTGQVNSDGSHMGDSDKAIFGNSNDLEIEHDGSHSNIHNVGTGNLHIRGNGTDQIKLQAKSGEQSIVCNSDGAVELYYDNSKKFDTTSNGINIEGTAPRISFTDTNHNNFAIIVDGNDFNIQDTTAGQNRLNINSTGIVSCNNGLFVPDAKSIFLGNSNDLLLKHDGTDSRIINNGSELFIYTVGDHDVKILADSQNAVICKPDGAVEVYYDNVKKLETTSEGISVVGKVDLTRQNTASEGGEVAFRRANDNTKQWYIDVFGSDNNASLRFHSETGPNGSGRTYAELSFDEFSVINGTDLKVGSDTGKLKLGTGGDIEIYHDGSNSYLLNATGELQIANTGSGAAIFLQAKAGENCVKGLANGAVELYYDNNKKLETTSAGATVTGNFQNNGQIIANLQANISTQGNPALIITSSTNTNMRANFLMEDDYTSGRGALMIQVTESGVSNDRDLILMGFGGKTGVGGTPTSDFHVHGNSAFNGTIGVGVTSPLSNNKLHLRLADSSIATPSTASVLLAENNTNAWITIGSGASSYGGILFGDSGQSDRGQVRFNHNGDIMQLIANEEKLFQGTLNGAAELYYDNAPKLETTANGITVTGSVTTQDMNMSNLNGNPNEVDNTKGSWSIQEGSSDLFIINRVTGKKYKFNLTEIS